MTEGNTHFLGPRLCEPSVVEPADRGPVQQSTDQSALTFTAHSWATDPGSGWARRANLELPRTGAAN